MFVSYIFLQVMRVPTDQAHSIAATANDITTIIGASVFIGISAAVALSYTMIVGELVPIKHRGYWYFITLVPVVPFAFFGAFLCEPFSIS